MSVLPRKSLMRTGSPDWLGRVKPGAWSPTWTDFARLLSTVIKFLPLLAFVKFTLRHGSNALDSSAATTRSSPVMLSAAKHLAAARDRPFAEFPLSEAHGLRVTLCDYSNDQGLFFTIEPCLRSLIL